MNRNWIDFIKTEKEKYKKIGKLSCPAFDGEEIRFNKYGFIHLQWKDRIPRSYEDQRKKFLLVPHAVKIIQKTKTIWRYSEKTVKNSIEKYWALRGEEDGKILRVILRKKNNGVLHFFSVMEE